MPPAARLRSFGMGLEPMATHASLSVIVLSFVVVGRWTTSDYEEARWPPARPRAALRQGLRARPPTPPRGALRPRERGPEPLRCLRAARLQAPLSLQPSRADGRGREIPSGVKFGSRSGVRIRRRLTSFINRASMARRRRLLEKRDRHPRRPSRTYRLTVLGMNRAVRRGSMRSSGMEQLHNVRMAPQRECEGAGLGAKTRCCVRRHAG